MAFRHSSYRQKRQPSPAILLLWVLIGALSGWLLYKTNTEDTEGIQASWAETHSAYLGRYMEYLLVVHGQLSQDGFHPEAYLSGYWTTEQIERDLENAYETAISEDFLEPRGYGDFALALLYLDRGSFEIPTELLEDDLYLQTVDALLRDEDLTLEQERFVREYAAASEDWWSTFLADVAGYPEELSKDSEPWKRYQRSLRSGVAIYLIWILSFFFIWKTIRVLFRPALSHPHGISTTWHPVEMSAGVLCAILLGIYASALLSFALGDWGGPLMWVVKYAVFAGGPVVILSAFYLPQASMFARTLGMQATQLFSRRTWAIVLGLYSVHSLWTLIYYEIQAWSGSLDTRDFLSVYLIDTGKKGLVLETMVAAICAPLFEEIIFRGFLFSALRNRMAPWIAALLSSLLFASLHHYSYIGLVDILAFGMIMCWIYHKTGTLWPGILLHAIMNFQITYVIWYTFSDSSTL